MSKLTIGAPKQASKGGWILFVDPQWHVRFEMLIHLTRRTSLIDKLTGHVFSHELIKSTMDQILAEIGTKPKRPRGIGKQLHFDRGWPSRQYSVEVAYLMRLHFGATGPGIHAPVELDLGKALDWKIEVYNRYRQLAPQGVSPLISFDQYDLIVDAVADGKLAANRCTKCDSLFVSTMSDLRANCPVCEVLELKTLFTKGTAVGRFRNYSVSLQRKA